MHGTALLFCLDNKKLSTHVPCMHRFPQQVNNLAAGLQLIYAGKPQGQTIFDAHERERYVYFPTGGIIAKSYTLADGASAAFAIVGNEGTIGVASILGGSNTPCHSVVMCSGHAYRLPAGLMELEFMRSVPLRHLLLLYSQALITQIGQIAVCNRYHTVEQQLCRCILTFHDRLLADDLKITQEQIAGMLGVRREGISEAAARLKGAGLICCSRGHITVLDRPRLEARACECYQVVRREYVRLLPPQIQGEVLLRTALSKMASERVSCQTVRTEDRGQRTEAL